MKTIRIRERFVSRSRYADVAFRVVPIALGLGLLSACVQVQAPDKPIVIELNINIRQEVVYRLDGKARELIEDDAEIF